MRFGRSIGVVAALCATQVALAADAPAPPYSSWGGFYAGIETGFATGHAGWSDATGYYARPPGGVPGSSHQDGLLVGGRIGYNIQNGAWVFGPEATLTFGETVGYANCGGTPDVGGTSDTCHTRTDWLGTLTGRIGHAFGPMLVYGRGGLAYAQDRYETGTFNPGGAARYGRASDTRLGWVVGAGVEYDLGHRWSVRADYAYYDLGRETLDFVVADWPGGGSQTIERSQQTVTVGVNYRFGGDDGPAPSLASLAPGVALQFGTRIGLGSGRFQDRLYDASDAGYMVSRLTHENLDDLSTEAFARADFASGLFVKGYIGGANIFGGRLYDEDFPPEIEPYSRTLSQQDDGRSIYGAADLGYDVLQGQGWRLGAFVGYEYVRRQVSVFSCTQVATQPRVCSPGYVPDDQLVISQREEWQGVRLGLSGEVRLGERLLLSGDATWLPYVAFKGIDNHWLRPDINAMPESGHGYGFEFEGVVSYLLTDRLSVGIGGRFTQFRTRDGQMDIADEGEALQPMDFDSRRYGAFLQLTYRFGG